MYRRTMNRKSSRRRRGSDGERGEAEAEEVVVEGDLFVPFSDLSGRPCGSVGGEWERPIFSFLQKQKKSLFRSWPWAPIFIPKFLLNQFLFQVDRQQHIIFLRDVDHLFGNHEKKSAPFVKKGIIASLTKAVMLKWSFPIKLNTPTF
jgi:hypothetical protein